MFIRYSINNLIHSTPAAHARNKPHKIPVIHTRNMKQRETRNLAAVNGVVIPSKVPSGQLPNQGGKVPVISHSLYSCSICGRKFVKKHHVKIHMWPCVQRNGNPNGVRWDDACNNKVDLIWSSDLVPEYEFFHSVSFQPVTDIRSASGQDVDLEDTDCEPGPVEDDKTDKVQLGDYSLTSSPSGRVRSPPIISSQSSLTQHLTPPSTSNSHQTLPPPSPIDSVPSRLLPHPSQQTSQPHSSTTSQVTSPPSIPYNENLRMDILSNEALLLMVQAWQGTAQHVGEEYVTDHPQFQNVMDELWQRGIVDEDSNWLIDVVDRFARRVVG